MSKEIDEKVVEMRFDNKQFEKGVSTTVSSLEKLKKSLDIKNAGKSFEDIDSFSKKINLSGLSNSLASVKEKLHAIKKVAAFAMIADEAIKAKDAVTSFIKSLSLDQIAAGWNKYNDKMSSVQAIMSATKTTWEEDAKAMSYTGDQMGYVNDQLKKLQWFTDETSYSYTDMVANIGKFTSVGRGLSESVAAMQGISTWAANSGANVSEAGRAMYNLSQAMGIGHVQVVDWKSIENANMATLEFKNAALEAGVAMGKLRKIGDGTYEIIGAGVATTAENFRESLQYKWFNSDILMKVLDTYGGFSNKLHTLYERTGLETNRLLSYVDEYAEALSDTTSEGQKKAEELVSEISKETRVSASEIKSALDELGSKEMELGRLSFAAAQETRTFVDAINYVKDAISSGWMQTFETLFGNYSEAKVLWTELSDVLFDIFVAGSEARNAVLSTWAALGGRASLIDSLRTILLSVVEVINTFKSAFYDFLPNDTDERARKLIAITEGIKNFTATIKPTPETIEKLKSVFRGFFAVLDIGRRLITGGLKAFRPVFDFISSVGSGVLTLAAKVGEQIVSVDNKLKSGKKTSELIIKIADILKDALDALYLRVGKVTRKLDNLGDVVKSIVSRVKNVASNVGKMFKPLGDAIKEFVSKNGALKIVNTLRKVFKTGVQSFSLITTVTVIKKAIEKVIETIDNFGKRAKTFDDIKNVIHDTFSNISQYFESIKNRIDPKQILEVAGAIGILTISLWMLSNINPIKLSTALGATAIALGELIGSIKLLSLIKMENGAMKNVALLIALSASMFILAIALNKIGSMNVEGVIKGVAGLLSAAEILLIGVAILSKINVSGNANIMATAAGMVLFAVALRLVSSAVNQFGAMNTESLVKGIVAIGLIMLEMSGFVALAGGSVGILAASAGMVLLSLAIKIIATALFDLSNLSWEGIAKGVVALAGVLALMTGVLYALAIIAPLAVAAGAAVLVMSVAIKIIASAMKELASITSSQLSNLEPAIDLLGILLNKLGKVLALVGIFAPTAIKSAVSLLLMGIVLKIVVSAMHSLSELNLTAMEPAIELFGKILSKLTGSLILAGMMSKKVLAGAASFILLGVALKSISGGLGVIIRSLTDSVVALAALNDPKVVSKSMKSLVLGIAAIGLALKSFDLVSINRASNLRIVAESLDVLKKPIGVFSKINKDSLKDIFKVLASSISDFGWKLKAFGPFAGVGSEALLKIAKAVDILVPSLEALAEQDPDSIDRSLSSLSASFESFGQSMKSFGPFSAIGAEAMLTLSDAIKTLAPGVSTLASLNQNNVDSTLISVGEAFRSFGEALDESPFWFAKTKAEGINKLSEGVSFLGEALPEIVKLDPSKIDRALSSIGDAFIAFGLALETSPFWGVESKAEAFKVLSDGVGVLSEHLPEITKINGNDINATLSAIGDGLKSFGAALKETASWSIEAKANSIATLCDSISSLSDGLSSFSDVKIDENVGRTIEFVGDGFEKLNGALGEGAWWGAESKAAGVSIIVESIKTLAEGLKELAGIKDERIASVLTSIGNGVEAISFALSRGPLFNSEKKANAVASVLTSVKKLSEGIVKLQGIPSNDIANLVSLMGESIGSFSNVLNNYSGTEEKAHGLLSTAEAIDNFVNALNSIKDLQVDAIIGTINTIFEALQDATVKISEKGLIKDGFVVIGDAIEGLSSGIKAISEYETNTGNLNDVFSIVKDLIDSFEKLQQISVEQIKTNMTSISEVVISTVSALSVINGEKLSPLSLFAESISSLGSVDGQTLSELVSTLESFEKEIKEIMSLDNNLFETTIISLATAIKGFSDIVSNGPVDSFSIIASSFADFDSQTITTFSDASSAVETFSTALNNIGSVDGGKIASTLTSVTASITEFVESIKGPNAILSGFEDFGESLVASISRGVDESAAINTTLSRLLVSARESVMNYYDRFKKAGAYLVDGFVNGISENSWKAAAQAKAMAQKAEAGANKELQVDSPSKRFYRTGTYAVLGFVNAFHDGLTLSEVSGQRVAENAVFGAYTALEHASDLLSANVELAPQIRPVIDLSNIQNGIRAMNGLMNAGNRFHVSTSLRLSSENALAMQRTAMAPMSSVGADKDVVAEIRSLRADVNAMTQRIGEMGVYLDGRTLVGKMSKGMDKALGRIESVQKRGV